jgi:hypothetical protein
MDALREGTLGMPNQVMRERALPLRGQPCCALDFQAIKIACSCSGVKT